jgi:hypothetical protein
MKTTAQKLIKYIEKHENVTAKELVDYLNITKQALYRYLNNFIEDGQIVKIGRTPKVFYLINKEKKQDIIKFDSNVEKKIKDNYFIITPSGERKEGIDGFAYWCNRNKLDPIKTASEYIKTLEKYDKHKQKSGLIDAMFKMKDAFKFNVYVDKLFYVDFYAIERFGKTRLGQILFYAKQSQDKEMIRALSGEIKDKVFNIIKEYKIDGVGFIPPTVKREVQFMKELEKNLNLQIRRVGIVKVKSDVIVPQKSLSKIEDRIENAERSIFVQDRNKYNNILLIDDAVGSGATFNEVGKKIKNSGICDDKIIALAIAGSFKGFDVISEV